uniref:Uncharacterized protein n=2 Tax=Sus scrofa TaxID=9823 RepID=A0A8D2A173_PIG
MFAEAPQAASVEEKGQKPFASGDYTTTKANVNKPFPTAAPDESEVTGGHTPLPQPRPAPVASQPAGGLKELDCTDLLIPMKSPKSVTSLLFLSFHALSHGFVGSGPCRVLLSLTVHGGEGTY